MDDNSFGELLTGCTYYIARYLKFQESIQISRKNQVLLLVCSFVYCDVLVLIRRHSIVFRVVYDIAWVIRLVGEIEIESISFKYIIVSEHEGAKDGPMSG